MDQQLIQDNPTLLNELENTDKECSRDGCGDMPTEERIQELARRNDETEFYTRLSDYVAEEIKCRYKESTIQACRRVGLSYTVLTTVV